MSSFGQAPQGIAAVAAQIQDRALQLSSEQAVLELVQAEQAGQQALLNEASDECGAVRRDFLAGVRMRYGVELELWKVQGKKQECIEALDKLHLEAEDLRAHKEEIQSNWGLTVSDLLADHQLKQEIYRYSIQTSMDERAKIMEKRSSQLQSLSASVATFRTDKVSMKKEKEKLLEALKNQREAEQAEDEEISNIGLEVQKMIDKVRPHLFVTDGGVLLVISSRALVSL